MKTYKKPMISIDEGLAEGVYAASGTTEVSVSLDKKTDWYQGHGRADYKIEFPNIKLVSITLNFNQKINGASGNTTYTISGNSVTFTYTGWSPESPIILSADVDTGLSTLELVNYSYTKQ